VPEHHLGRRRRQSKLPIGRLLALAVALLAVLRLLTLGEPEPPPAPEAAPVVPAVPTWSGPNPVDVAGTLVDGDAYTPRVFLTAQISAGVATSADGTVRVVLNGPGEQATELRRLPPGDRAQINGFAFDADNLVWMETVTRPAGVVTSLWRSPWRTQPESTQITTNTGAATFANVESDVVVHDGRAYWAATATTGPGQATEVRSVALTGGQVDISRLTGEYRLTSWPGAVSIGGGRGAPVTLLDLTTGTLTAIGTEADEVPVCSLAWCRISVSGAEGLVGIDLARPDGGERRRIAGPEATPIIADATLLDRYVPLATDRGEGSGLSLYDAVTGRTDLVAVDVANVQGRDGVLWWSTGAGTELVWHAVDLHAIP
jgi:hypothetical protein